MSTKEKIAINKHKFGYYVITIIAIILLIVTVWTFFLIPIVFQIDEKSLLTSIAIIFALVSILFSASRSSEGKVDKAIFFKLAKSLLLSALLIIIAVVIFYSSDLKNHMNYVSFWGKVDFEMSMEFAKLQFFAFIVVILLGVGFSIFGYSIIKLIVHLIPPNKFTDADFTDRRMIQKQKKRNLFTRYIYMKHYPGLEFLKEK